MLYKFGKFIFWILFRSVFSLKVYGSHHIPRHGGFILASNHVSNLDPVVLGVACSKDLNFMAKEELFWNPLFGVILRAVHAFPLKRHGMDISAFKEAMHRVNHGEALLIFPEGTRVTGGELGKAQEGIGFLAQKLNVPVVPAFISGTDHVLPKESGKIRRGTISVRFGKQISLERRVAYSDVANSVMEAIKHLSCLELN